ncbi:MAG: hypothetical protein ACE5D8_06700 [Fidelibacterota bacterium]
MMKRHPIPSGTADRKSLVYIAVFGTFWGLMEASLGSILHAFHFPFTGSILSALGLVVLLVARKINPAPGSSALMGVIAGLIKIMGLATVKLGPFIGIVMEGLLVESILSLIGPGRTGFLFSGIMVGIYPIVQTVVTKSILFGANFLPVILETARGFSETVGRSLGWWILIIYAAIHILFGLIAALTAWALQKQLLPAANHD